MLVETSMMTNAQARALQIESDFLAGVQANLAQFGPRLLRGRWFERAERDNGEAVRAPH